MSHNLPLQVTAFIRRTDVLQNIIELIKGTHHRLVTIVGMGGIGKTRLSLAVGQHILDYNLADNVYFVPLAPLTHANQLTDAIADAIGLTLTTSDSPEEQLITYLGNDSTLLILDNFEHILDGHTLVIYLLAHCPSLTILVTSRESLNSDIETAFTLQAMTLPTDLTLEDALKHDAIQLFVQIAQKVDWGFQLTHDNLPHIVNICQRVEGLPLAIELSAAWLRMISIDKIQDHLNASFDLLADSLTHVPDRHRSIRAVFESSWQLLTDEEQEIYAQLSIFRGGFTHDAVAEMLSATPQQMLSFIDKSLIYRSADDRYTLHELLRQYAEEKLQQYADNHVTISDRHARYYARFLADREAVFKIDGRLAPETVREIEAELDNIRLMWYHALEVANFDLVASSVETLYHLHRIRGSYRDAVIFMTDAHNLIECDHQAQYRALYIKLKALIALTQQLTNQTDEALQLALETYELAQRYQLPIEIARSELALSIHWTTIGDLTKGQYYGELALTRYEHIQDIEEQTNNLMTLGWAYQLQGDFANAERVFQKMLIQNQSHGNIYQAAQGNIWLALLHNQQGKYLTAKNYALKALSQFESIGGMAYAIAVRKNIAVAYWGLENYTEARRYFEDTLDVFVKSQRRFIAGILSTMAWIVHLMHSEGNDPMAVELGAFILQHPQANYETKEIVNKIYPDLRRNLSNLIFDTAEDQGNNSTMEETIKRLKDYFAPDTSSYAEVMNANPELKAIIQQTLDTGTIPEKLSDETSRDIATKIVNRVEAILETEKSRMMANFMESASHDLRTPITIINSSLYLLEHIKDPVRQKDKLELVKSQVNHLHSIIEKLLLMSRLDRGVSYDFYDIDIAALLRAIVIQYQPRSEQYNIPLKLESEKKHIHINADSAYLQDAILNVIDNAFQFSSEGEQVTVILTADDTHAIIQIKDNGIGIANKHLPYVFDRFYRIDSARRARGEAGLGLSITKHIIDSHNGICEIESELNKGTIVTLRLPIS